MAIAAQWVSDPIPCKCVTDWYVRMRRLWTDILQSIPVPRESDPDHLHYMHAAWSNLGILTFHKLLNQMWYPQYYNLASLCWRGIRDPALAISGGDDWGYFSFSGPINMSEGPKQV